MTPPPPGSTLTDPLFPYTTLFRSCVRSPPHRPPHGRPLRQAAEDAPRRPPPAPLALGLAVDRHAGPARGRPARARASDGGVEELPGHHRRSEEHTSELPSLTRISYAVFCLKKQNKNKNAETY